jgi:hypothetical protein
MPLRLLVLFFSVFLSVTAVGQPKKNDINIRTNILSWLEPNAGGPVLGMEYFINNKFSIGADAGFIFYNLARSESDKLANPLGYRVKPEIRYYLYKKNKVDPTRLFFALEGLYLKTRTLNYNDLPITANMGNIVYYYIGGFNEYKKVAGANIKFGMQIQRFLHKKMMIELYAGLGFRQKIYTYKDLPAGALINQRRQSEFLLNTDIDGTYPSITGGFKLVYKIKN